MRASASRRGATQRDQQQHQHEHHQRREEQEDEHPPDWSIPGDAQEQERILLEREVVTRIGDLDYTFENTDTQSQTQTQHSRGTATMDHGPDFDSGTDDDNHHDEGTPRRRGRDDFDADDTSIEYGRHDANSPRGIGGGIDLSLSSFVPGGAYDRTDDMEYTDHDHTHTQTTNNLRQYRAAASHSHSYSFSQPQAHTHQGRHHAQRPNTTLREGGDDSLLRAGDTLSTAQHHASGITLGAGLGAYGNGPFTSRTPSRANISVREFDPERKLPDLLLAARVNGDAGAGADAYNQGGYRKRGAHAKAKGSLSMLLGEDDEEEPEEDHGGAGAETFAHRAKRSGATHASRGSKDKSHLFAPSFGTADPIIVEDTAELDAAIESGRLAFDQAARAERYQSDPANDSEASDPEAAESESSSSLSFQHVQSAAARRSHSPASISLPRSRSASGSSSSKAGSSVGRKAGGKLSDALAKGEFSPKRPRSALGGEYQLPVPPTRSAPSAPAPTNAAAGGQQRATLQRSALTKSAVTAKNAASRPTGAASRPPVASSTKAARLPDMTGLTSAVETPARAPRTYRHAHGRHQSTDEDATIIIQTTVEQLALKIRELETENITSRRRVRELELDLDRCRADVVRERTRVQSEIQRHMALAQSQQQRPPKEQAQKDKKGKARAVEVEQLIDLDDGEDVRVNPASVDPRPPLLPQDIKQWEAHYREVVDTKKALERLVGSLRTQLAQMTAELDEHKQAVEELRAQRDEDAARIIQRSGEVDDLRAEIERLGVEVRRLRTIIEESLRERRTHKSDHEPQHHHQQSQTRQTHGQPQQGTRSRNPRIEVEEAEEDDAHDMETQLEESAPIPPEHHEQDVEEADESVEPAGPSGWGWSAEAQASSPATLNVPGRRPRDRLSTVGEEEEEPSYQRDRPASRAATSSTVPVERPGSRLQRTRSKRSTTPGAQSDEDGSEEGGEQEYATRATINSTARPPRRFINIAELDRIESEVEERRSVLSYAASSASDDTIRNGEKHQRQRQPSQPQPQAGPSQPKPASTAAKKAAKAPAANAFPQIRGSKMERLFFSLPDHNEATCRTCRQNGTGAHEHEHGQQRPASRAQQRKADPRDSEDGRKKMLDAAAAALEAVRQRKHIDEDALPPQAVMARLLRELEDDFMHYKSTYLELAEQYGAMDPASNPLKRNVLADHLREVIDSLEQKGDQIAALYDAIKLRKGAQSVMNDVRLNNANANAKENGARTSTRDRVRV